MTSTHTRRSNVAPLLFVALLIASPAVAGPPLLCHPYDIGNAASLPWGTGGSWSAGLPNYDVSHLVADTQKLLGPATPVVVRMETLRRAAIYAGRDVKVAADLLAALTARARATDGTKQPDALAYLDAAYVIGAFQQIGKFNTQSEFGERAVQIRDLVRNLDGYAVMKKALMVRPGDAGLEFAAAKIAADTSRAASETHAQRARAIAANDPLVVRNLKQLG